MLNAKLPPMFKLDFDIPVNSKLINHQDQIVSIGSCFSDNIGSKLKTYKFKVLANPFGTLFNPHSIFKVLSGQLDPNDIIENQGIFYHWDTHGEVSSLVKNDLPKIIEEKTTELRQALKSCEWLIITLGTSFIYTYKSTNKIVGNCHKFPQFDFTKSLLRVDNITSQFQSCIDILRKSNPEIKVILTVSPVRHTKDGLHENNISKGILHQAVSEIIATHQNTWYFPSYEILIDELRDYRFYKEDMIHPSDQAVAYIWDKFKMCFIDSESNLFIDDWNKILVALAHQAFHPTSDKHQKFILNLIKKLEQYASKINVEQEIEILNNQLMRK